MTMTTCLVPRSSSPLGYVLLQPMTTSQSLWPFVNSVWVSRSALTTEVNTG